MAAHKARQAQKAKKTQVALQKAQQKVEADNLSRKHLAGLRVVQKNLVYVTGLQPTSHEDQLLQTLRGHDYFGQYGKIIKIVVSKAKDTSHPNSVGVYVTFERKDDAEKCITAVNGSKNQERTLRAQFGTTKYCSAYLRGETCTNRNCMFLHEPGEANESYSRADLSTLNAGSSQPGGSTRPPPPQSQQPVAPASASQPMAREPSSEATEGPPADRPALPSTASWATKMPQAQHTRLESRSTSATMESPVLANPTPAQSQPASPPREIPVPTEDLVPTAPTIPRASKQRRAPPRKELSALAGLVKHLNPDDLRIAISIDCLPQGVRDIINSYPPLFDPNGGAKRRVRRQREEEQRRMEQEAEAFQQPPPVEADENMEMRGSLQLGGEPEDRQSMSQPQSAISPPGQEGLDARFHFGGLTSPGVSDRAISPQQQHQQMLLQSMNSSNAPNAFLNSPNQPSSLQPPSGPPGHQRNTSRFSFANESSASTNVKPVANAKLMNQQSAMMPQNQFSAPQSSQSNSPFFGSNVQGPPPGIKMSGTPPVSGGMTFGQGHGFATGGIQYGLNAGMNANEERMRSLLRGRDATGLGNEASKREFNNFPPYSSHNAFPTTGSGSLTGPPSYASLSSFSGEEKQRKKKGKKHRHNNTSSSGGGLMDDHAMSARYHPGASGPGAAFGGGGNAAFSNMHGGGSGFAVAPGGRW